ncbi:tRNA lysidine(34) synthetase TilS [Treponema sp.]|uniref:tRNA lysidine(34) synthetase TilS n=1 Tax=Treponema sp. TaxID=166 RepID=UPI00388E357F
MKKFDDKNFEKKVLEGLKCALSLVGCGVEGCSSIGVAVSGGADSVSLLCALKNILPENIVLKAVTVNHNIRPSEETSGDADYVEALCANLGICCVRYEIERGLVGLKSENEKTGIEDSARRLRYEKFSEFIAAENIDYLCLAHNRNDQEETVLMRFLQGSGDLSGIPMARDKYIRPLLDITRSEIENYLTAINVSYRTDSTNLENDMMRNRIRNLLVPVLNEKFDGWKRAVESLAEKSRRDNHALDLLARESLADISYEDKAGAVTFDSDGFYSLHKALRDRILMLAVKSLKSSARIPQSFISRWSDRAYAESRKVEFCSGIQFRLDNGKIALEKKSKVATEEGFFAIIEEPGDFFIGETVFNARKDGKSLLISCGKKSICLEQMDFPFVFRSRQPGDEVKCSDGTMRSLSGILDGWKTSGMQDRIPVVQQMKKTSQNIKCIWGSLCGFNDWIVLD